VDEHQEHHADDAEDRDPSEANDPGENGPESGAPDTSPAADRLPGLPAEDDSALGDTDQHSDA
jgi:hypothetical protein